MKILIRGTNWIGDSIMSIPAMREVRRIFPEAHITLHTRSLTEGLFANASFLDEIVSFEKNRWPFMDVYDNSSFLREEGFDAAILFPNSFESALTTFLAGIPVRIGYNKDVRGFLLTHPVPVPEWKHRRHEAFYYLNLVSIAGQKLLGRETVSLSAPDANLEVSEERRVEAEKVLAAAGIDTLKQTVLLGVGSTNSNAKRWPAERFAQLSDQLQDTAGVNVVLIGSDGDAAAAAAVTSLVRRQPIDLVGKTTVAEAAALISIADLVIANDMGLAHVAPSVGTKTIVIFGPTNPLTTRPFSDRAEVIRHDVPCSPCMLRECPIDHRCMTGISPDAVMAAATRMLAEPIDEEVYETSGSIS